MLKINRFANVDDIDVTIKVNTSGDTNVSKLANLMKELDTQAQSTQKRLSKINVNVNNKSGKDLTKLFADLKTAADQTGNALGKIKVGAVIGDGNKELTKQVGLVQKVADGFRDLSLVRLTYLVNAIRRVTSGLVNAVKNAAGYEESLNLYKMALGQYAERSEEWVEKISSKLMLDESAIYQYAGSFFNLSAGLGVVADDAYIMSQALTQLTYDMSSYLNISVEAASTKLQSAMSGQSRAVQSVGIAIQAASLQELAYRLGIEKTVSTMTQAEKTYLRYIQLLRSTEHMQGDLARTMITPANAIRILETQIRLLGRAIGQVLTPIIMEVIPWIMAATEVLKGWANALAEILGYKVADVDYSTAFIDTTEAVEDYSDAVGKAGKKVKNSLAPFDELNVVMSSRNTGSGSAGLDDSILEDLRKHIGSYDMLAGYTDKLKKKAEELRKPVEKLLKLFGALLGAAVIGKVVSRITKVILNVGKFIKRIKEFKIVQKITSWFKEGVNAVKLFVGGIKDGLSVSTAFKTVFGTVGQVVVGATAAFGSFAVANRAITDALEGTRSWGAALLDSAAATTVFATAAGVLIGPAGVIAAIGGGLIGATTAYAKFKAAESEAARELEIHQEMYDGYGVSVESLGDKLTATYGVINQEIGKLDAYKQKYDDSKVSVHNAKESLDLFVDSLGNQNEVMSTTDWETYKSHYDSLKTVLNEAEEDALNYGIALINSYGGISQASGESTAKQIADFKELQNIKAGYSQSYMDAERKIVEAYYTGKISVEEYKDKIHDLKVEYGYAVDELVNADGVLDIFNNTVKDIDYTNLEPKELKEYFDTVSESYTQTKEKLEGAKQSAKLFYDEQRQEWMDIKTRLEQTQANGHTLTAEQEKNLQKAIENINKYNELEEQAVTGYNNAIKALNMQTKDVLTLIYADLIKNGADTSKEFEGTVKAIEGTLGELSKTDLSEGGKDALYTYLNGISSETTSTKFRSKFEKLWKVLGDDGVGEVVKAIENGKIRFSNTTLDMYSEFGKAHETWKQSQFPQIQKDIEKDLNSLGKSSVDGYKKGIAESVTGQSWNEVTSSIGISTEKNVRDFLEIRSPSKTMMRLGLYTVAGFAEGIDEGAPNVTSALDRLITALNNKMKTVNLSLNINTNIESSLNSILTKLQSFCNKWTNAINKLMSNMKNSMNGIQVSDGKISYTKMPTIAVSKFAEGGYPTSGDLFFANEDGRAEFITSIGNKTAVANQDQMVQALTNAIMAGFAMTTPTNNSRQPININIGGKNIYSGVVGYQNRQADRYGTTTTINV